MAANDEERYQTAFVRSLFDEMAKTYGIVNLISSFGFAALWRKQCITSVDVRPGMNVVDLMTGMGELCAELAKRVGTTGAIQAIDLSPAMCRLAREKTRKCRRPCEIIEADALSSGLQPECADIIVSSFGLKTFSPGQIAQLAEQTMRLLKPGGCFSYLEISVPKARLMRVPYLYYITHVIPLIGRMFLGNPDCYRMLGVYTKAFVDCSHFKRELTRVGLTVQEKSHVLGCATSVFGYKPIVDGRSSKTP